MKHVVSNVAYPVGNRIEVRCTCGALLTVSTRETIQTNKIVEAMDTHILTILETTWAQQFLLPKGL